MSDSKCVRHAGATQPGDRAGPRGVSWHGLAWGRGSPAQAAGVLAKAVDLPMSTGDTGSW